MTIKETLLSAIAAQVNRRRESQQLEGDARHQAHLGIRSHRFDLRHLYLAYALERAVPYEKLEQKCRHAPSVDVIAELTCVTTLDVALWLNPPARKEEVRVEVAAAHAG